MRTPVNGQRWKEAAPVLRFNEKKKKKFLWMHGDSPRAFNMAQATPPAAAPLRIGGGGGGGRRGCRGSEDGCFGGLCLGGCVGREVCFCMGMVEEGRRFGGRGGWGQTRHPSCVSIGEERGRVAGLMQQRLTAWAESELVIKLIDERSTQRGGARPNSANQISICVSTGRSRGDDWPCLSWRRSLLLYLL